MVSDITDRDRANALCASLKAELDQLDPTGLAWQVKDIEFDLALAELFALGPNPTHPPEEPWPTPPAQRDAPD